MPAEKQTFDPRRAKPGQALSYIDTAGKEHTIRADDDGVLRPTNAAEKHLADQFGLPVARSAKESDSAGSGGKDKD